MAAADASRLALTLFAALAVVSTMMGSSHAYDFYVGGKQGWVQSPSESYDAWAGRNRFQVNDRLVFRYKKGEDSVLVVTDPAYRACDASNPIRRLDGGGDSVFQFDRSGPFYFISGVPERCRAGQKLAVVVLSPRGGRPAPPVPAAGPLPPPPAGLPPPPLGAPPPALPPPPAGAGPGGAAAPPSELPRGQAPSGSSPLRALGVAALTLAGATFLFG